MNDFSIAIEPSLPVTPSISAETGLDNIDPAAVLAVHSCEYNLVYQVGGKKFQYYPSSIITVLNDLHYEWTLVRERKPHQVTIAGYAVLEVEFRGEAALFSDPLRQPEQDGIIGEPVWVIALEEKLKAAIEQIVSFIKAS